MSLKSFTTRTKYSNTTIIIFIYVIRIVILCFDIYYITNICGRKNLIFSNLLLRSICDGVKSWQCCSLIGKNVRDL